MPGKSRLGEGLQPNHLADAYVLGQLQQRIEVLALVNPGPVYFDFECRFGDSIAKNDQALC